MKRSTCEECNRRGKCRLEGYARATFDALVKTELSGNEFERFHQIGRCLRGNNSSPGYLEDMRIEGAFSPEDARKTIQSILEKGPRFHLLVERCRHYLGPNRRQK